MTTPATSITAPAEGEMTLISFYQRMAGELSETSRHLLNLIARSLVERGWVQPVSAIVEQLVEHGDSGSEVRAAAADLAYRRLLVLAEDGDRIASILGSVSVSRTAWRGHLSNGVDIFVYGGMDLLSLNATFARGVDCFCECEQCSAPISFSMDEEAVTAIEPSGVAGFQASWDGVTSIEQVSASSPLFCSDDCLNTWQDARPDLDGLPLVGDLLLHVGAMMANESGSARFQMVATHG